MFSKAMSAAETASTVMDTVDAVKEGNYMDAVEGAQEVLAKEDEEETKDG